MNPNLECWLWYEENRLELTNLPLRALLLATLAIHNRKAITIQFRIRLHDEAHTSHMLCFKLFPASAKIRRDEVRDSSLDKKNFQRVVGRLLPEILNEAKKLARDSRYAYKLLIAQAKRA